MDQRDIFDVLLFVAVSIALYVELYGATLSPRGLTAIVSALQAVDIVYYLVAAGVLGVVFVSYITIYLPQKYSQNPSK
ncbi:hypothetical protein BRC66_05365 [Halobacteriales archaeon QH_2_66_30]|nr:MAG: hypothetical protein BRC66_05365 [Halobacteriales archaeon QH_2_66_30]